MPARAGWRFFVSTEEKKSFLLFASCLAGAKAHCSVMDNEGTLVPGRRDMHVFVRKAAESSLSFFHRCAAPSMLSSHHFYEFVRTPLSFFFFSFEEAHPLVSAGCPGSLSVNRI